MACVSVRRCNCCVVVFIRVMQRQVNVDSLLHCTPSPLHSGLSVVRDPTTGMLLDFTEVAFNHTSTVLLFNCLERIMSFRSGV